MDIYVNSDGGVREGVDCLVIPVNKDTVSKVTKKSLLTSDDKKVIKALVKSGDINGESIFYLPTPLSPYKSVLILGMSDNEDDNPNYIREATGKAVKVFQKHKKRHLLLDLSKHVSEWYGDFVEALVLGQYSYNEFKGKKEKNEVEVLCVHIGSSGDVELCSNLYNRAKTICESANWARDLANAPGNAMTPSILAKKAEKMVEATSTTSCIMGEKLMKKLGMNSLLAVSAGSEEEAKLIILEHKHPEATKTIAIVGKGLTFDAGGISLKPGNKMEEMKFDMCGGAAMLGAMRNVSLLNPKVNVICVVPSSENMPSSKAVKPGDIVKSYSGKTIEIYNTDAEGRLILADALAYTVKTFNPDMIVDAATLTGAVVSALGHQQAAIITEDEEMCESFLESGLDVHERLWPLPLNQEYKDVMKGKDADLCNIGKGGAGTVTAAAFLSNFVGDTRWAHLDIAGVAWGMTGASYIDSKLGSGFGVRLVTDWIMNQAN